MLVALVNVVKVESVPLNSNYFARLCGFVPKHTDAGVPIRTIETMPPTSGEPVSSNI